MSKRVAPLAALAALLLLFAWIYGRFAPALHFVFDDSIEAEVALAQPWLAAVIGTFTGAINWSGYRPLSYGLRAALVHLFGVRHMLGYYVVTLGLHLLNTLLTFHLVRKVGRSDGWAFVAAAAVLLLPAHNEAVLWFVGNSNLLGLLFVLLTLLCALHARSSARLWPQIGAALCSALALLAYEVTLPLILLVALADWGMDRAAHTRTLRQRWPMYAGMALAVALALGLRLWVSHGQIMSARSDYGVTLNPLRIARGYVLLLGQIFLLHTTPWPYQPLFVNVRDWMSPLNPRALASIALTLLLASAVLWAGLRPPAAPAGARTTRRPRAPFWLAWGLLWLVLMALPFAALGGRNPENRYTYIPAFGMAVALAALAAWAFGRAGARRWLRAGVVAATVALLTFYAYVDTSDVAEWERAAAHARAFLDGAGPALAGLPPEATIAQVGVPGNVGTGYVFTTAEGFGAAMRLHFAQPALRTLAGDLPLRDRVAGNAQAAAQTALLGYNEATHTVVGVAEALFCASATTCTRATLLPTGGVLGPPAPAWTYALVGDAAAAGTGAVALLIDPAQSAPAACWQVLDLTRVQADPRTFDEAALAARCQATADALRAAGQLDPPL